MEYEGFVRCLSFLKLHEFNIDVFVSDRHISIAKHMREKENGITHYFDLWHLKKSMCTYLLLPALQQKFSKVQNYW